jgi:hypothetical protein
MNFQAIGLPIARLKTKFNKKAGDTILYYDEKSVGKPNFPDEIDLRKLTGGSSSSFQIIPSSDERSVIYICGKSGSGKTYYIKCYIQEFHKEHPKSPIWFISPKYDDTTLKEVKKWVTQLRLDDEFLKEEICLEDLRGSLVIFDDIEAIMDKQIKEKVFRLLNLVMTDGRSYGISCCIVSHSPTNGKETRLMLLENSHCAFFPNYLSDHNLNYLCKNYLGLDKGHIDKILKTNDRSCSVLNNPRVVITDKLAFAVRR